MKGEFEWFVYVNLPFWGFGAETYPYSYPYPYSKILKKADVNLISEEACFKKWSKAKIKELKPLEPGNGYCAIGQWFFTWA